MSGKAIGKYLRRGFVGNVTRGDSIITGKPVTGSTAIQFGAPVRLSDDGNSFLPWATGKAFVGVAVREVKTNSEYAVDKAEYLPGDTCDVLSYGGISVVCTKDETATTNPVKNGKVYLRKATGLFVAAAEGEGGADTEELKGVVWAESGLDTDGLAEITILMRKM